jgi:molybdate transport system substrate-binding protein
VATNFKIPAQSLTELFHQHHTQHRIRLVSGSTGKLYTQILHGAPFDIFMAADAVRPARLEAQGFAAAGSRRTYAVGQLALLARTAADADTLLRGEFRSIAMANPQLAPYGMAAEQVLKHMRVRLGDDVKVVYGENVGQAYAMVTSGNAELGLVARSLVRDSDQVWMVPSEYHPPIRQQLVLMQRAAENVAAQAFLAFLGGEDAARMIQSFGYLPAAP